jgi:hypothetical protein
MFCEGVSAGNNPYGWGFLLLNWVFYLIDIFNEMIK